MDMMINKLLKCSNMIKIIENAIPQNLQTYVKNVLLDSTFPWFLVEEISGVTGKSPVDGWVHMVRDNRSASPLNDLMIAVLTIATHNADVPVTKVERIRVGLFTRKEVEHIHNIHTDYEVPHIAMLYYVIDSDGPTYFYDENGNVIKTVMPKAGTAVIFDGLIPHSSSSPVTNSKRIVVNYNFYNDSHHAEHIPNTF